MAADPERKLHGLVAELQARRAAATPPQEAGGGGLGGAAPAAPSVPQQQRSQQAEGSTGEGLAGHDGMPGEPRGSAGHAAGALPELADGRAQATPPPAEPPAPLVVDLTAEDSNSSEGTGAAPPTDASPDGEAAAAPAGSAGPAAPSPTPASLRQSWGSTTPQQQAWALAHAAALTRQLGPDTVNRLVLTQQPQPAEGAAPAQQQQQPGLGHMMAQFATNMVQQLIGAPQQAAPGAAAAAQLTPQQQAAVQQWALQVQRTRHEAQQAQQAQQTQRQRRLPNLLAGEAARGGGGAAAAARAPPAPAAVRSLLDGLELAESTREREPPEGMLLTPLLRHQRIALHWMCAREDTQEPRGGILADDQGLGKTVSTIALIITNRPQARQQGQPTALRGGGGSSGSLVALQQQQQQQPQQRATPQAGRKRPRPANGAASAEPGAGPSRSGSSGDEFPTSSDSSSDSESSDSSSSDSESSDGGSEPGGERSAGQGSPAARRPRAGPRVICLDGASPDGGAGEEAGAGRLQGGTLVVCPTTVLHQWAAELRSKVAPAAALSVHVYHGKGKAVSARTLAHYGVVLTTYQTMALEAPRREGAAPRGGKKAGSPGGGAVPEADGGGEWVDLLSEGEAEEAPAGKRRKGGGGGSGGGGRAATARGGPLYGIMWHRVVLDEAQCIKNTRTLAAHAAWSLRARARWCLSGTPMQNSVDDLFSYLRFLKHEPYGEAATFRRKVRDPIAAGGEQAAVGFKALRTLLKSVMMRRTKQSTIDGKPIIELPPRLQQLVRARLSPEERAFYERLQQEASLEIKKLQASAGGVGQHYVGVLWQLLRLRQACNHPSLVRGVTHRPAPAAAEVAAARRLPSHAHAALSELLRPQHLTPCAVCGDVPEDAVASLCLHAFCRQCVATEISKAGHGAAEAELAFRCPADGCGHVLGRHDTFSAEVLAAAASPDAPQPAQAQQAQQQGGAAPGGDGGGEWRSSAKLDALMDLLRKLRDKGAAAEAEAKQQRSVLTSGRSLSHARLAAALGGAGGRGPQRGAGSGSGAGSRGNSPRLPMEKVIVFSQWTAMLDLAEVPLRRDGFAFRRLDGTMAVKARQAAIDDFCRRPEVGVMLVSLKAASLGLNLVAANHVVLLDLWYNPTVEEQAIDRAHRIGQTRAVHVTRITVEDSVEERILELQQRKRGMIAAAVAESGADAGGGGLALRPTADELTSLIFA